MLKKIVEKPALNYLSKHDEWSRTDPFLLVKNLLEVEGPTVLEKAIVREGLIRSLDRKHLMDLCDKLSVGFQEPLGLITSRIVNRGWSWKTKFSKEFCDFFDILDAINDYHLLANEYEATSYPEVAEQNKQIKGFFELHGYQSNLRDDFLNSVLQGEKNILLRLPTGGGKTRVAIHSLIKSYNTIFKTNGTFLWLAYDKLLIHQACEQFYNIWNVIGHGNIPVTKIFEDYDEPIYPNISKQVLFASIIKLRNRIGNRDLSKFAQNIKLIIFDEVHQIKADVAFKFINALRYYNPRIVVLGLTATPGRGDLAGNDTSDLVNFFDCCIEIRLPTKNLYGDASEIAQINSSRTAIKYLQELGVLASLKEVRLNYVEKSKYASPEDDPDRNELIISITMNQLNDKKKVLLFASSVKHAKSLAYIFKLKNYKVGLILSENNLNRERLLNNFKQGSDLNLLINYGVLTTGFDAPHLDTVVISRVTNSIVLFSQILGRALRGPLNGGNSSNTIINISDPGFHDVNNVYNLFKPYWEGRS